jgi:hypothetical protein
MAERRAVAERSSRDVILRPHAGAAEAIGSVTPEFVAGSLRLR